MDEAPIRIPIESFDGVLLIITNEAVQYSKQTKLLKKITIRILVLSFKELGIESAPIIAAANEKLYTLH